MYLLTKFTPFMSLNLIENFLLYIFFQLLVNFVFRIFFYSLVYIDRGIMKILLIVMTNSQIIMCLSVISILNY
jgi:hypothetical protein